MTDDDKPAVDIQFGKSPRDTTFVLKEQTPIPAEAETTQEERHHWIEFQKYHPDEFDGGLTAEAILRDLASAEARVAVLEEARKLGNLSNALWVDAEKEIEELKASANRNADQAEKQRARAEAAEKALAVEYERGRREAWENIFPIEVKP